MKAEHRCVSGRCFAFMLRSGLVAVLFPHLSTCTLLYLVVCFLLILSSYSPVLLSCSISLGYILSHILGEIPYIDVDMRRIDVIVDILLCLARCFGCSIGAARRLQILRCCSVPTPRCCIVYAPLISSVPHALCCARSRPISVFASMPKYTRARWSSI